MKPVQITMIAALIAGIGLCPLCTVAQTQNPKKSSDELLWTRSPEARPRSQSLTPVVVPQAHNQAQFTQPLPEPQPVPEGPKMPATKGPAEIQFKSPAPGFGAKALPISLPAALQLVNVRALDIAAAYERLRVATALHSQAKVLWIPTISLGADYYRHDGVLQNAEGAMITNSRSTFMVGLGTGLGSAAVIPVNDAVFAPLAARRVVNARQAEIQAATNDSFLALTEAYFNVQQARGELAGAIDATARTDELAKRVEKLATGLVSPLEVVRAQAELARRQQTELAARERWRLASAELLRVLHLQQGIQLEPVEPPTLTVNLLEIGESVDELIAIGLTNRPELAAQQAQVQALLTQLRQERLRPLIPSVVVRGASTQPAGTFGYGAFGGGTNASIGNYNSRFDADVQVLWQLDNFGFGNRARIDQRAAESRLANVEFLRVKDRVALEVSQAHTNALLAIQRKELAERGLRLAIDSAEKNLVGVGQTRRVGEIVTPVIRPQEAIAAVQALGQAYADYFGAIADSNRAQFRLYRALGKPAQELLQKDGCPTATVPQNGPISNPR